MRQLHRAAITATAALVLALLAAPPAEAQTAGGGGDSAHPRSDVLKNPLAERQAAAKTLSLIHI